MRRFVHWLIGSMLLVPLGLVLPATAQTNEPDGPRNEIRALGSYDEDMRSILATGAKRPAAIVPRTKRRDGETDVRPAEPPPVTPPAERAR